MDYRSFGRTGVPVSALSLGCMMFGGRTPDDESMDIIDKALDQGINVLDTANVYSKTRSEVVVGNALKRNGKRDRVVLATKVHRQVDEDNVLSGGNNRRHIIEQCDASLKRLQTDYIDLYQIHRPSSQTPIDETLRALDDLIQAGKVRYIGTSNYPTWRMMESLWVSKELGLNRFVSVQVPYNLLDRSIERELIPMVQTYGLAVIPYSPLARGFLTGKYKRSEPIPEGTRLEKDLSGSRFSARARQHVTDRAFDVVEVVEALANEKGCTPSQVALAWLMKQPGITSPIIGPRTMEQFEDNIGAVDVHITAEDEDRLNEVAPREEAIASYVNGFDYDYKPSKYNWL